MVTLGSNNLFSPQTNFWIQLAGPSSFGQPRGSGFSHHAEYTRNKIKKAYEWLAKGKRWKEVPVDDTIVFYIPSGNRLNVSKAVVSDRTYRKFSTFIETYYSAYTVVLKLDDWRKSSCTCVNFFKKNMCKHVYGLACEKQLEQTDENLLQIPIGRTRGPGRPKKALPRTALIVETHSDRDNLCKNQPKRKRQNKQ